MSYFPQIFTSYFSHSILHGVLILSFLFLFITGKATSAKKWKQSSIDIWYETDLK